LVIATHGRSFWILDDMTPLRQAREAVATKGSWLYQPATAVRIDNDVFTGTPLPPEEPTADNPPSGAIIDYILASSAKEVVLEILDANQKLVRKFSSSDRPQKHSPGAIAERWYPKPEVLETSAGMHRFVWNLVWGSSDGAGGDEGWRSPSPPKAIPGTYQLRLTVDGQSKTQPLQLVMDPRSPATSEVLEKQFELSQRIYSEAMAVHRTLAEIKAVQKQLADLQQKASSQKAELKAALTDAQTTLNRIVAAKAEGSEHDLGLEDASPNLASALHVVESGDRETPAGAIAVYNESREQAQARTAEWSAFKQTSLPALNERLRQAGLSTISVSPK
ncbi:MAG: hypothetical protein ACRD3Q_07525, partial [Terriglobales bacterium]